MYNPKIWYDGDIVTSGGLNNMEQGIAQNAHDIEDLQGALGGDLESYVNDWLDSHPEATTTVQDGTISPAKLNAELKNKVLSFMTADSNLMHVGTVDITPGYNVQAICYDSKHSCFYVGVTSSDNNTQIIYTLDDELNKINTTTINEQALHLNTMTYNSRTDKLYTIRSSGYELLEINLTSSNVTVVHTFTDFNSGVQYDPVRDVYVGINGPSITHSTEWQYFIYDNQFNKIKTGSFVNPYGYNTNETPNGFCCYDGKMVHSSFNTSQKYGGANKVQFIFEVDYDGNVGKVYQEYFKNMEYEGIAYSDGKFFTVSNVLDGKLLITLIDPSGLFSRSLRLINQRVVFPVEWDSTYVDDYSHFRARIDMESRTVSFSGYVRLISGSVPNNTEVELGTIPETFWPFGDNVALPSASGSAQTNLAIVKTKIRFSTSNNTARYINFGGSYVF